MANDFTLKRTFQAYNKITATRIAVTEAVIRYDTPNEDFIVRPLTQTKSIGVVGIGYVAELDHIFQLKTGPYLIEEANFGAHQGYSYRLGSPYWICPPAQDLIINLSAAANAIKFWTCLFLPSDGPPSLG